MDDINESSIELEEKLSQKENDKNISLSIEEENYNSQYLNQNKNKWILILNMK